MKPGHRKMTEKSPMYIYATEMVSSYYKYLGLKGKKVLSIVGSGDQIINAYCFGAKEVIGFDINKRAYFILDLKLAAINKLKYQEFLKFFGSNFSNGTLSFNLYNKLKNGLSLRTKNFFDKIYQEFSYNGKKLIKSEYFRQRSMIDSSTVPLNHYLRNENEYLKCRAILQNKKIHFIKLDVNDILISKKLKDKFDIINLSNVLNYLTGNTADKDQLKVLANTTKKISQKLNKNGLFFYYSYSPELYRYWGRNIPPASQLKIVKQIKKINNFTLLIKNLPGISPKTRDRINIFSKK